MKHVLIPMLAAVLVRVLFLVTTWDSPFFLEPVIDAKEFHDEAVAISSGEGLPARPYDRPPLFSFFVALVYAVAGPTMRNVFPLHALLGIATTALCAHAARRLFGARVAIVAGLLMALARLPMVMEGQLLGETLQTFLLTLALTCWVEALHRAREGSTHRGGTARSGRESALVVAGAVAGALAVVTRPASLLVVIPSLCVVWWMARRAARSRDPRVHGWPPRPAAAVAGVLIVATAVGAVTIRNRVAGGEWVAVSYNGGINFFIGNGAKHDELMDVRPGLEWERLARTPRALGIVGAFRVDPWRDGFAAWDRRYYRAAFEDIARDPIGWLAHLGRKALVFWSRVEIERNLPMEAFVRSGTPLSVVTLPFVALAPFALTGLLLVLWRLVRRAAGVPPAAWLVVVSVLGVWGTCIAYFVTARYRAPAYPAMAILAAWMLAHLAHLAHAVLGSTRGGSARSEAPARDTRAAPVQKELALALVALSFSAVVVVADPGGARRIAPARETHLEAVVLERLGRTRAALETHRAAIAESPDDPDVVAAPMALLIALGQPEVAIPLGERAVALLPDHPSPLFNLGLAYQQAGRPGDAVDAFERLVVVSPDDARAHFQLGRSLTLGGRPEAALAPLSRAAELAPEMPLPLIERARALIRLGRDGEARAAIAAARRVDPGVARVLASDPELSSWADRDGE